jgi:LacI family transcriptional regulator
LVNEKALCEGTNIRAATILTPSPFFASFCVDEHQGGSMQARHLGKQGHRRVIYHGYDPPVPGLTERRQAFLEEAERWGMEVQLVLTEYWDHQDFVPLKEVLVSLERPSPPTAIACWNDWAAWTWIEHLTPLGIQVPEDLAVIGYDGVTTPKGAAKRLTTVSQGFDEMTELAMGWLCSGSGQGDPGTTFITPTLTEGDTA